MGSPVITLWGSWQIDPNSANVTFLGPFCQASDPYLICFPRTLRKCESFPPHFKGESLGLLKLSQKLRVTQLTLWSPFLSQSPECFPTFPQVGEDLAPTVVFKINLCWWWWWLPHFKFLIWLWLHRIGDAEVSKYLIHVGFIHNPLWYFLKVIEKEWFCMLKYLKLQGEKKSQER